MFLFQLVWVLASVRVSQLLLSFMSGSVLQPYHTINLSEAAHIIHIQKRFRISLIWLQENPHYFNGLQEFEKCLLISPWKTLPYYYLR